MQSGVDFTATDPLQPDFNWSANSFNLGADPAGNPEVRYIIHRMCDVAGPSASVNCVRTSTGGTGQGTKGGATYGSFALPEHFADLLPHHRAVHRPAQYRELRQVMVN